MHDFGENTESFQIGLPKATCELAAAKTYRETQNNRGLAWYYSKCGANAKHKMCGQCRKSKPGPKPETGRREGGAAFGRPTVSIIFVGFGPVFVFVVLANILFLALALHFISGR